MIYQSTRRLRRRRAATSTDQRRGRRRDRPRHRHHLRAHGLDGEEHGRAPHRATGCSSTSRIASPDVTHVRRRRGRRLGLRHHAGTSPRCCARSSATTTSTSPPRRPASYTATARSRSSGRSTTSSSTLRLLADEAEGQVYQYVDGGSFTAIRDQLTNMGQILLDPPSVFGWDWESGWVSSATLLARYDFARDLTSARGGGGSLPAREARSTSSLTDPGDIVDAVADVLGVQDQLKAADKTNLHRLPDRQRRQPDARPQRLRHAQREAERPLRAGDAVAGLPAALARREDTRMAITRRQFITAHRPGDGRHAARPEPLRATPSCARRWPTRSATATWSSSSSTAATTVSTPSCRTASGALRSAYDGTGAPTAAGSTCRRASLARHAPSATIRPPAPSSRCIPGSPA